MYNIIMVYNLGVSLSSSRSWRMGTRCESHRKEGLLSTPTNQKKKSSHRYDDDVKGKVVINTIGNIRPYNWVKMGMI